MLKRTLTYFFPFFLLGLETVIRSALNTDTSLFTGPAIASAAAGLLVPLIAVEDKLAMLPADVQTALRAKGATAVGKADKALAEFAPLILFACIGLWGWLVVLAERKDVVLWFGFPRVLVISLAAYFSAVVLAEIKEFV